MINVRRPNVKRVSPAIRKHLTLVRRAAAQFSRFAPQYTSQVLSARIVEFYKSSTVEELDLYTHHHPIEAVFDFARVSRDERAELWNRFLLEFPEWIDEDEGETRSTLSNPSSNDRTQ